VVSPPVNPATDLNLSPIERFIDLSAIMATHRHLKGKPVKKEAEWYGLDARLSS
jgi:hypothetical protein